MVIANGLYVICSPGGYSPYVRIGWLRFIEDDEYEIVGARVIARFGRNAELSVLARKGPQVGTQADTQLLTASEVPVPIHRLHMIRLEPAVEDAWKLACPRPRDWRDAP